MPDNKLIELQQIAKIAPEGERLLRAVQLHSEETSQLKNAYAKLQERFERVNKELSEQTGQFLNHLLQNISEGVLFIDLNGTIQMGNEAVEKMVAKREFLKKRFWDHFTDEEFGFSVREALRYGISHKVLYKTFANSGRELEISTSFLYEGPKGLIVLLRDITERQKLQQLAGRTDRMKELGEMTTKVAHEIRNPLGGIRGFATLLYRDLFDQPHLQHMVSQVIEGTQSLEKLVTNVLLYARPVQVVLQTMDLTQFLKQVTRFFRVDPAFPPNVKLELNISDRPLLVPFDPEALKRGLLNLLFNAIQAMADGGTLTITLLQYDANCHISIADTGIGMREEELNALFSPLFTTKGNGNGIGLVETQKIIQAHGGAIDVRSVFQRGSTFTITLPLRRDYV